MREKKATFSNKQDDLTQRSKELLTDWFIALEKSLPNTDRMLLLEYAVAFVSKRQLRLTGNYKKVNPQQHVARILGITEQTIISYLKGKTPVPAGILFKLVLEGLLSRDLFGHVYKLHILTNLGFLCLFFPEQLPEQEEDETSVSAATGDCPTYLGLPSGSYFGWTLLWVLGGRIIGPHSKEQAIDMQNSFKVLLQDYFARLRAAHPKAKRFKEHAKWIDSWREPGIGSVVSAFDLSRAFDFIYKGSPSDECSDGQSPAASRNGESESES
jgi:transcriptional regulator with XRE-family HTH domain